MKAHLRISLLFLAVTVAFSESFHVFATRSDAESAVAYILAISEQGAVSYLAMRDKEGKIISSDHSLSDNDFGPSLANTRFNIDLKTLEVDFKTTSYGQSLIITRGQGPIKIEEVKLGVVAGKNSGYVASFKISDLTLLPSTKQAFEAWTIADVERVSGLKRPVPTPP
jgi:hypothetical protein